VGWPHGLAGAESMLRLADIIIVPEYRSDDSCVIRGQIAGANDGHYYDGGPNQDPEHPGRTWCSLGTDATDCGTPPAAPPQTLAITVNNDGSREIEGLVWLGSPMFNASSGPCEIAEWQLRGSTTRLWDE
jgi:hypothetical protein